MTTNKTPLELAAQVWPESVLHDAIALLGEDGIASLVAVTKETCIKKIQAEIDHAMVNDTRLEPHFGQRTGDFAVRVTALHAAIDAIRLGK